jgi:hypothetical protein
MSHFTPEELERIRTQMRRAGARDECAVCGNAALKLDQGRYGLTEVEPLLSNPTRAPGGTAGPTGRIATCILFVCSRCGWVRLHSLASLDLDTMV